MSSLQKSIDNISADLGHHRSGGGIDAASSSRNVVPKYKEVLSLEQYVMLDHLLGDGGFGEVFEGKHKVTKARVAVKVVEKPKKDAIMTTEIVLMNMIRVAESPYLTTLHSYAVGKDHLYLILDLCRGNLAQLLITMRKDKSHPVFDDYMIKDLLSDMVKALKVLQKYKIMHRDIQPSNILLKDRTGSTTLYVLGDFGSADLLDENKKGTQHVGTPGYMCPEIGMSKDYDESGDIFSLGVSLYESAFGKRPFQFDEEKARGYWSANPLPYFHYTASEPLVSLLTGMLQISPRRRISLSLIEEHEFLTGTVTKPSAVRASRTGIQESVETLKSVYENAYSAVEPAGAHQIGATEIKEHRRTDSSGSEHSSENGSDGDGDDGDLGFYKPESREETEGTSQSNKFKENPAIGKPYVAGRVINLCVLCGKKNRSQPRTKYDDKCAACYVWHQERLDMSARDLKKPVDRRRFNNCE